MDKINITISMRNWNKMLQYAHIAYDTMKSEIGGMAVMLPVFNKDNSIIESFTIEAISILEQEVSGGWCELTKESLASWYGKMIKEYQEQKIGFLWWHSHNTMGARFSAHDHSTIKNSKIPTASFAGSLVINLKEEYELLLELGPPLRIPIPSDLIIINPEYDFAGIEKEVAKLCNKQIPKMQKRFNNNYNSYANNSHNPYALAFADDTIPTKNKILPVNKYSEKSEQKKLNQLVRRIKVKDGMTAFGALLSEGPVPLCHVPFNTILEVAEKKDIEGFGIDWATLNNEEAEIAATTCMALNDDIDKYITNIIDYSALYNIIKKVNQYLHSQKVINKIEFALPAFQYTDSFWINGALDAYQLIRKKV